jgi:hypothetical protein
MDNTKKPMAADRVISKGKDGHDPACLTTSCVESLNGDKANSQVVAGGRMSSSRPTFGLQVPRRWNGASRLTIPGQTVISLAWNAANSPGAPPTGYTLYRDPSAPQRCAYQPLRLIAGTIRHRLARLIR